MQGSNIEIKLTIGKWYDALYSDDYEYGLINDDGNESMYLMERFKTLDEVREEQLNKLIKNDL